MRGLFSGLPSIYLSDHEIKDDEKTEAKEWEKRFFSYLPADMFLILIHRSFTSQKAYQWTKEEK